MTEKTEKEELKGTGSFTDFVRAIYSKADAKRIFDEIPVEEVRQKCLGVIGPDYEEDVEWFAEKVKKHLAVHDFKTVFMLLRALASYRSEYNDYEKTKILPLMVDLVESCLGYQYGGYYLKDALVILCGKIYNSPQLYDEKVRKIFQDILERYDRNYTYGMYEEESRVVMRVFLTIAKIGDETFLPLLRKNIPDAKNLKHLMNYSHTCYFDQKS